MPLIRYSLRMEMFLYNAGNPAGCAGWSAALRFMIFPALLLAPLHTANAKPVPIYPCTALVLGPDGYYWGTSQYGGEHGQGTIYKIKADGTDWATVLSFTGNFDDLNAGGTPEAELVSDGASFLWGTTWHGDPLVGTVYKVNATSGLRTTVVKFTGDQIPPKGGHPYARLVGDGNGSFWGSTSQGGTRGGGTVFKVNAETGVLTTVVEFSHNVGVHNGDTPFPEYPNTALVSDDNGFFWGTTLFGGTGNHGTIYKIHAASGEFLKVLEFSEFGATNKGSSPNGNLVNDGKGSLWGTTSGGGIDSSGTVYKINTKTGVLTTLVKFDFYEKENKGRQPRAGLVSDGGGYFWGTTGHGGTGDHGTVFKIQATTGKLITVVEFTGKAGNQVIAGLVNDGHGSMLGATTGDTLSEFGTVFKIDIKTGKFTTLVDFSKAKK